MFIPQLDVNEIVLSHLKDFLLSVYQPSYQQKLSYWERNDYFTSVEVGEIGVLYLPFVFKNIEITRENTSPEGKANEKNYVSLSAFPPMSISSKKLFLKWMLRINKYRALEDWQVGYQMLGSQKGTVEVKLKVREEFSLWFETNALFREAYQASFTHKTEVFYEQILQEKISYSMILTIVLAELWFEFNKGRNQPTFHQEFEIEFTQNLNPSLSSEKQKPAEVLEKLTQEKEIEKEEVTTKEILNMQEAADFLSLAKQTLYTYTSKQEIPFYKKGKKIHFKRSELEKWLNSGRKATKQEIEKEALKQVVEIRKKRKK